MLNRAIADPAVRIAVANAIPIDTILARANIAAVNMAMFSAVLIAALMLPQTTSKPPAASMASYIV